MLTQLYFTGGGDIMFSGCPPVRPSVRCVFSDDDQALGGISPFYNFGAFWDNDELIIFWGQKLKGQGHGQTKQARTTVNYLQYLVTGSTLTAVGPFQLPAPQSGTLSRILSGTRPSVQTVLDVCLERICSLDTSAFSALEVPDDNCAL